MKINEDILLYAAEQPAPFNRSDLLEYIKSEHESTSDNAVSVQLHRLINEGKIDKVGYGKYTISKSNILYHYHQSELLKTFAGKLKEKFPFVTACVWQTDALVSFMHNIPSLSITRVDVEKDVLNSVFSFLQKDGKTVLLDPGKVECERYVTGSDVIVIRPLISESPIEFIDGLYVPTMEKMIVDVATDYEFGYIQGAEFHTICRNISASLNINRKRMYRYASRRNKRAEVEKYFKEINV